MTNRAGCLLGLVLMATPLYAHHSFGTFDLNRKVELVGTIAGIDFVNPHSWLRVNVTAPDGRVTRYRCEMRGATVLRRSGWTPEMFVVGERITVQGAPDRVDPHACYVNTLVLADGRTLDRYTQQAVSGRRARPTGVQSTSARLRRPARGCRECRAGCRTSQAPGRLSSS